MARAAGCGHQERAEEGSLACLGLERAGHRGEGRGQHGGCTPPAFSSGAHKEKKEKGGASGRGGGALIAAFWTLRERKGTLPGLNSWSREGWRITSCLPSGIILLRCLPRFPRCYVRGSAGCLSHHVVSPAKGEGSSMSTSTSRAQRSCRSTEQLLKFYPDC